MKRVEYRIVRDNYAGFEIQQRRWWWPFWRQVEYVNTHFSVESAEQWIRNRSGLVVKYLGDLSA